MSGVEAMRIMSVVEDMVGGLGIMSYLTADVRHARDELEDVLGQEIAESIQRHEQALAAAKGNVVHDDVMRSVLDVWRLIKRTPGAEARLATLQTERTDSTLQVLELTSQLQAAVRKRLTSTVEEDNSRRDHFEEVKIREEKAVSEKQQLQQKLKLDRIERQKQINLMTQEEERATSQLDTMQATHAHSMHSTQQALSQARGQENSLFQGQHDALDADVQAAVKQLSALRAENTERMVNMRKAKKKCSLDAEAAIMEYDKEVSERDGEYQKELAMFTQLTLQLQEQKACISEMQSERSQHEDKLRRAALMARRLALENLVMRRAVRIIKEHWYAYQAAKKKAKKAAAKAKPSKK